MKKATTLFLIFIFFSCKKDDGVSNNNLIGNWTFTNETSTTSWNWAATTDSMYVTFDNSNHYVYRQYSYPVDNGTYSISKDSIVILKPDSSYSSFFHLLHNLFVNGPDSVWHFTDEKLSFKINNLNQLIINSSWSGTYVSGNPPTNNFVQNHFYFVKRQ